MAIHSFAAFCFVLVWDFIHSELSSQLLPSWPIDLSICIVSSKYKGKDRKAKVLETHPLSVRSTGDTIDQYGVALYNPNSNRVICQNLLSLNISSHLTFITTLLDRCHFSLHYSDTEPKVGMTKELGKTSLPGEPGRISVFSEFSSGWDSRAQYPNDGVAVAPLECSPLQHTKSVLLE